MSSSMFSHSHGRQYQHGKTHPRLLFTLLILGLLLAAWFIFKPSGSKSRPSRGTPPTAVGVASVQQQTVPLQLSALGTVTSTYTVTVHSRVDGQLEKLHFTEGQLVKQGQLLAELDPRPYQAALTQAQGQLLRDQALLENAQLDLTRYQQLLSQNAIAKQQVDTQRALVRQYQGTVKVDQGIVANAKLQLDYSRITAPVSGRVGLRQVDPGNIVHAGDANGVVVITQTSPINVLFAIPEVSLSSVLQAVAKQPQLKVSAWNRDSSQKLAEGEVLALDNQLNTATGTINIKAKFANEQQQLFPNQFVNVQLQLGDRENAIIVPSVAVQLGKVGHYVYTVNKDETVSLSKVKIGPVSGDSTIIEEGVRVGQKVVVDGLDKLRDGAQVKVVDRAAQAKEALNDSGKPAHRGQASGAKSWGKRHASASR
ncbi:MdtA/MuxA family multidrug efflux RND transporter periplasmic adaptor subunit [Neisseriaceae bacterium TC5R-5]|nr:MdtA/MuxA family multidrug efflux RND transporter periplasmic adaptor subunit [Neisseriaceae bacterium TC5R-5]